MLNILSYILIKLYSPQSIQVQGNCFSTAQLGSQEKAKLAQ